MAQEDDDAVEFDLKSARRVDRAVRWYERQPADRTIHGQRLFDATLKITGNEAKAGAYTAVELFPPATAIDVSTGTLSLSDVGRVPSNPQTVTVINPYEVDLGSHVLIPGDIVSAEPHGITTAGRRCFKVRNCLSAGDCGTATGS